MTSIHRTRFKSHYDSLLTRVYMWQNNAQFDNDDNDSTYYKSFRITNTTPFVIDLKSGSNRVCDGNNCEPDVVKCPIEHVLLIEGKNGEKETVFDFQPMTTQATEDDEHGRNILKYRAEYGIFDADFYKRNDGQPLKQDDMQKITVYHPRYHLKTILDLLDRIKAYQYPVSWSRESTIREMGRRYIFLSGDYIEQNRPGSSKIDALISNRERDMMVTHYGIPGSWDLADQKIVGGDPLACSMNQNGKKLFKLIAGYNTNNDSGYVNLRDCRYSDGQCEAEDAMLACRPQHPRNISRPCGRNVWYMKDKPEFAPNNTVSLENGQKTCPFDGYGTEIPDEINDVTKNNVCWKGDFLLENWDTKCKDFKRFKKNYCGGAPTDDLKHHDRSDDYKNARYFIDPKCNFDEDSGAAQEDLTKMCEWAGQSGYNGPVSGHDMANFCGCHKRTFSDMGKYTYFLSLTGNQVKLDQIKRWSQNSAINGAIYNRDTKQYGISSTDEGIVNQIASNCWASCQHMKGTHGDNFIKALNDEAQQSCSIQGCFNTINAYNNNDTSISDVRQQCNYTGEGGVQGDPSVTSDPETQPGTGAGYDNTEENDEIMGLESTTFYIIAAIVIFMIIVMIMGGAFVLL